MPANQTKTALIKEKFPEAYVRNGFNGKKTILELKPELKTNSAEIAAHRLVSDAKVQQGILEVLEKHRVNDELVSKEFKHILTQRKHYPAKVAIIDQYHKLKGYYAPDKSINANINIPTDNAGIDKALEEIQRELKSLTN